jgi:hypothetical protein
MSAQRWHFGDRIFIGITIGRAATTIDCGTLFFVFFFEIMLYDSGLQENFITVGNTGKNMASDEAWQRNIERANHALRDNDRNQ